MKNITIAGTVGKDAEVRSLSSGQNVANFSVAVSEGRDKPTTWFECSLWGKRGEVLAQYITKGSKVTVTGSLTVREHDGKTYLGVNANDIALQGGKQGNRPNDERSARHQDHQAPDNFDLDDDINF